MDANQMTHDVVSEVARELRERYACGDGDVQTQRSTPPADDPRVARQAENLAFAEQFMREHHGTFERLTQ